MLTNKLIKEEDIKNKIIAKLKCSVYRSGCKNDGIRHLNLKRN